MHGGPPPQRASGMREGTRAVKEPPRGMKGAGQSESMDRKRGARRSRRQGWSEIRGPGLITSNLEPQTSNPRHAAGPILVYFHFITFWSTNSGADQQHTPSPRLGRSQRPLPRFVGTRLSTPPPPPPTIPHQS